MQVLYFAWMRERIGVGSEEVDLDGATTARELIAKLHAALRGPCTGL